MREHFGVAFGAHAVNQEVIVMGKPALLPLMCDQLSPDILHQFISDPMNELLDAHVKDTEQDVSIELYTPLAEPLR